MSSMSTPVSSLRFNRSSRWVYLLAIFFLALGLTVPAFSAVRPLIKTEQTKTLTSEQQYNAAQKYAARLEHETVLGENRDNWLNNAHSFQKIYITERKGSLGPPSLYMTAKIYQRMFELFKDPLDLETALNTFLQLEDIYPGHALADDALYNAADCAQQSKGQELLAVDLYKKIVTMYPQGDQYERVKARSKKPEKKKSLNVPIANLPVSTPQHLVLLSPVKYWSSKDYTRIVLQAAAPVSFTTGVIKSDTQSPQLYIDVAQSSLSPKSRVPITVRDGLLKKVRSTQRGKEDIRVVLDLESLSEYTAFSLADPFRIIIDIRSVTAAISRQPTAAIALPPQTFPMSVAKIKKNPIDWKAGEDVVVILSGQKKRLPLNKLKRSAKSGSHEEVSLAQQLGLGIRKIIIDPGHGGKDPGAMAFGLKEKDIVLKIAKKVGKILKDTYGYEVLLTRTKDVYIPLEERTAIANTHKSDLFISIHINAHTDQAIRGVETYYLNLATDANAMRVAAFENATSTHSMGELQDILVTLMNNSKIDESARLARFVQTNLVSGLGRTYKLRDLGVKQGPFYVLIGAEMPAILAEISFITNPEEAKLLQNEQYLDKVAGQLVAGIVAYVDHHVVQLP